MEKVKKINQIFQDTFKDMKESFVNSKNWEEYNAILDNFLDELNLEKNTQTRYIAYSRIVNLKTEPLSLYLDTSLEKVKKNTQNLKTQIPNKLENKTYILDKAYDYVKRIYENYYELFIKNLEEENFLSDFDLALIKWTFNVWKFFNIFAIKWLNYIKKQNEALDKMFDYNQEKVMNYLKEKDFLEKDEKWNIVDRSYSVLKWWKVLSYEQAFPIEIKNIAYELEKFIEDLQKYDGEYKKSIFNI